MTMIEKFWRGSGGNADPSRRSFRSLAGFHTVSARDLLPKGHSAHQYPPLPPCRDFCEYAGRHNFLWNGAYDIISFRPNLCCSDRDILLDRKMRRIQSSGETLCRNSTAREDDSANSASARSEATSLASWLIPYIRRRGRLTVLEHVILDRHQPSLVFPYAHGWHPTIMSRYFPSQMMILPSYYAALRRQDVPRSAELAFFASRAAT